jgi:hypothetical protein
MNRNLCVSFLLAVFILALWPAVTYSGASTLAAQSDVGSGPGLTGLASCLASNHRLQVAVMMDESGSLGYPSDGMPATDPTNQRVPGLQELLASLASLATGDAPTNVTVGLTGFSTDATVVQLFSNLTPQTLPAMDAAATIFAKKNTGPDTDFYSALSAAQKQLALQSAAVDGESCQAIVLFTDGFYSFSVRPGLTRSYAPGLSADTPGDAQALAAAGTNAICESGGLIDQIRADGTYVITVGLGPGAGQGASFLSGVAGAGGCGTRAAPGGLFLPVSDVGALREAFDVAGAEISGGTEIGQVVGSPRSFYLSADLSQLLLLVRTNSGSTTVAASLTGPDRTAITLPDTGTTDVDGLDFTEQDQANGYVVIRGLPAPNSSAWAGQWTVSVTSAIPDDTTTDILEYGDLVPTLKGARSLTRGHVNSVSVALRRLSGAPPDIAEQSVTHTLEAQIIDPTAGDSSSAVTIVSGSHPDSFVGTYDVPDDLAATSVNLELTLSSIAPDGSTLTRVQQTFPLAIETPPSYPKIEPLRLNFGSISGSSLSTAELIVSGGTAKGCFSIGRLSTSALPQGVRNARVQSPSGCLSVGANDHRSVTIQLVHAGVGSGRLTGALEAKVRDSFGQTLSLRIPTEASFVAPVNQARRLTLLLLLLLGGILLPLLIMYGLALFAARFRPIGDGKLRYVQLPISVTGVKVEASSPEPDSEGAKRELDANKLMEYVRPIMEGAYGPRRIEIPNGPVVVRSNISMNPFAPPIAWAEQAHGDVVASLGTQKQNGLWRGELTPLLGASWVFQVTRRDANEANEPRIHGMLTFLCAETPRQPNPWPQAVSHALSRLPEICAPLLSESDQTPPSSDGTNGGGSPSGPEPDESDDPRMSLNIFPT